MQNKLLSITRGSIPYIKELKPYAGSITACILMQQLDYWLEKKPEGFYKFKEPCKHELYSDGDSWCEELGFSAEEFDNAFLKIGIKYKSRTAFFQAEDKFKGKFYASYTDKISHLTYYFRNDALVDTILCEIITKPNTKANFTVNRESRFTKTENVVAGKPGKSVSIYRTDTTTETTSERATRAKKISVDRNRGDEPMEKPLSKDAQLTEERRKLILDGGIHPTQVDRVWNEFKSYRISKGDKRVDWDADLSKWCLGCRSFNKWAFEEDPSSSKQPEERPRPEFTGETFTDRILEALYAMVDSKIYHAWLENLKFKFDGEAKKVIVTAPSKFVIDWITTHRVDNNILFSSFDVGCEAESVEFKVS